MVVFYYSQSSGSGSSNRVQQIGPVVSLSPSVNSVINLGLVKVLALEYIKNGPGWGPRMEIWLNVADTGHNPMSVQPTTTSEPVDLFLIS